MTKELPMKTYICKFIKKGSVETSMTFEAINLTEVVRHLNQFKLTDGTWSIEEK